VPSFKMRLATSKDVELLVQHRHLMFEEMSQPTAMALKAGDDAAQVEVVGNWRDRALAFDHRQMIEDSLKAPELCISQRS